VYTLFCNIIPILYIYIHSIDNQFRRWTSFCSSTPNNLRPLSNTVTVNLHHITSFCLDSRNARTLARQSRSIFISRPQIRPLVSPVTEYKGPDCQSEGTLIVLAGFVNPLNICAFKHQHLLFLTRAISIFPFKLPCSLVFSFLYSYPFCQT